MPMSLELVELSAVGGAEVRGLDIRVQPQPAQIAASALDEEGQASARAVHPVVSAHRATGLPGIYVNPLMTTHILGVSQTESDSMLNHLFDALDCPCVRFEHQWRIGDTLLWDNRGGLLHTGRLDYPRNEARRFIRTTVSGDAIEPYVFT